MDPQQQNYAPPQNQRPVGQMATNRGIGKIILLSIVTVGIYGLVFLYGISRDINIIASRYDGKTTMNAVIVILLSAVTLGILPLIWYHGLCDRIGKEKIRRNLGSDFSSSTFWMWAILGSFIIVGPFVFLYKLCNSMNQLSESYNTYG